MSEKHKLMLFQAACFFIGFGLLAWVDWRIAVGVLMAHWANNIREDLR